MVSVDVKHHVYLLYGVTVSYLPVIINHLYIPAWLQKRRILDVYDGDGQTDRQTGRHRQTCGQNPPGLTISNTKWNRSGQTGRCAGRQTGKQSGRETN